MSNGANWLTVSHREFQRALSGEKVWIEHPTYGSKLLAKYQDGAWHCRWLNDNGKPVIKSTRCRDWVEAVAIAATKYEGRHAAAATLFRQAAEEWHAWGRTMKGKERSPSSLAEIRLRLDRHLLPLLGHVAVEDFSDATMLTYRRNHEARSALSVKDPLYIAGAPTDETINGDVKLVRAIIDFGERYMVPAVRLKNKMPALGPRCTARRASIPEDRTERLVDFAASRIPANRKSKEWWGRTFLRFNMLVLNYTGCRPGEGRRLRIKDIGREINPHGFVPVWIEHPKVGTPKRFAYADPRILDVLAAILAIHPTPLDPNAPLFVTKAGKQVKEYHNCFNALLRALQAKEPDVAWLIDHDEHNRPEKRTLYSFRHAYATKMLSGGVMGMASLKMVMGTSLAYIEANYWHPIKKKVDQDIINRVEGERFAA